MDDIVDFEYLLRPIDEPVESPRIERFEIRSKRTAEFDKEERYRNFMDYGSEFGEEKSPEPPDWSAFIRECETHLAKKVKDLWVSAWYTEALLIRDGFAGLAGGFQLATQMADQFWDVIQPPPDAEDGVEDTVRMYAGLNNGSAFIDRLMLAPISVPLNDSPALTVATLDTVEDSVRAQLISNTDQEFQEKLGAGIRNAISAFSELSEILEQKCGDDAPPSAKLREALNQCETRILEVYPSLVVVEPDANGEGADGDGEAGGSLAVGGGGGNLGGGNHIQNREEAFKLLEKVSKFFRENEPSSPVSYALLQAVRWGRMSLPDLLNDLVEDENSKNQIFRMTGLKPTNLSAGADDWSEPSE